MEKRKYNIGDPIELQQDWNTSTLITNTPVTIHKGTTGIIVAGEKTPTVLFPSGYYVPLSQEFAEMSGQYNLHGLATWLWQGLEDTYGLDTLLKEMFDVSISDEFVDKLEDLLNDLGFEPADDEA